MAKTDAIKETIGWLKLLFGAFVVADFSLIGWLAQNYDKAGLIIVIAAAAAALTCSGLVFWFNDYAFRCIKQMEDQ